MPTVQTTSKTCEHCGKHLEPIIVKFLEREYQPGFKECKCPGARAKREHEERMRAQCELREKGQRMMEAAGIPPRYADAVHPKASEFGEDAAHGQSLYVFGPNGTGKTHLAMAIARWLLSAGIPVRVTEVPALMEAMRNRKAEDRGLTESLKTCRVLVLEELGKEAPTEYACERLFDIVNFRYNQLLPVIVTSNYDLNAVAKRLTGGETGRAISSRLTEMCKLVRMNGDDRRLRG